MDVRVWRFRREEEEEEGAREGFGSCDGYAFERNTWNHKMGSNVVDTLRDVEERDGTEMVRVVDTGRNIRLSYGPLQALRRGAKERRYECTLPHHNSEKASKINLKSQLPPPPTPKKKKGVERFPTKILVDKRICNT